MPSECTCPGYGHWPECRGLKWEQFHEFLKQDPTALAIAANPIAISDEAAQALRDAGKESDFPFTEFYAAKQAIAALRDAGKEPSDEE